MLNKDVATNTQALTDYVLECAGKFIRKGPICDKKHNCPWMTSRCTEAISQKVTAASTEQEGDQTKKCANILKEERLHYVESLKRRIAELPKGSKIWWRLNRELLDRKVAVEKNTALEERDNMENEAQRKGRSPCYSFPTEMLSPSSTGEAYVSY